MEENKMTEEGLFKVRSYLECLGEGVKLPTRHILHLLGFLYPSMIACVVTGGLWGMFATDVSVVLARLAASPEPMVLNVSFIPLAILALLTLLSSSFHLGQVMTVVSHYAQGERGALRLSSLRREVFDTSLRALTCIFIGLLFLSLAAVPLVHYCGFSSVWTWTALTVWGLLFGIPYYMVCWDYMLDESHTLGQSLRCFKTGFRHWAASFVILLCGWLMFLALSIVAWLPALVLTVASHVSEMAVLYGDPTDLPQGVCVGTAVLFMIATFFTCMFSWLRYFPQSFLYGSVEALRIERENFEREDAGGASV